MLELGDDLNFASEPVDVDAGELRVEDLHYHLAVERPLASEEDTAHSSAAKLALDGEDFAERFFQPLA
jgi:hypothetical protein